MAESRFVLVTGATRGLGRAMVAELTRRGHRVAGCGRSLSAVKKLETTFGKPHRFDCLDVVSDQDVQAWAESVLRESGPPDLLLNNAAIINDNAKLWEVPAADFNAVIDVNIKGVANVIRHFVPAMVKRKSGVIVNFSSGWGRSTSAKVAPYCATKWAIEGLTQALAQELPAGMAAVPLDPGIINTDMLQSCFGSEAHQFPNAEEWSRYAVPFILSISAANNGEPMSVTP